MNYEIKIKVKEKGDNVNFGIHIPEKVKYLDAVRALAIVYDNIENKMKALLSENGIKDKEEIHKFYDNTTIKDLNIGSNDTKEDK